MKNVFQTGDAVYHTKLGKVTVRKTFPDQIIVGLKDGTGYATEQAFLSFSPWPEPNHIRPDPPIKEGWWLLHIKGDEDEAPLVRYVSGKSVYFSETQEWERGVVREYVFVRYLGQDWKKETP